MGTAQLAADLSLLVGNSLEPWRSSLAQVFVTGPLTAVHGQPFVLREESPPSTIGGGRVLQPSSRRIRRRDRTSVERLGRLRSDDPVVRLSATLEFQGLKLWTEAELCRMTGLPLGD